MTLAFYTYNNYYNRIVKKHDTIEAYVADGATEIAAVENIAFNPNDGVTTTQIVNTANLFLGTPDYALLLDGNAIVSRWYVLECVRIREGQYRMSLLRDLIADNYDKILSAPMFVEKAFVGLNDPRIFNNENMTYNQIKTREKLLKNYHDIPWIVGYIDKKTTNKTIAIPAQEVEVDYDLASLEEYTYYNYTYETPIKLGYHKFGVKMYLQDTFNGAQTAWDRNGNSQEPLTEITGDRVEQFPIGGTYSTQKSGYWRAILVNWGNAMYEPLQYTTGQDWMQGSTAYTGVPTSTPSIYASEDGKIIKAGDKYYRIKYETYIGEPTRVHIEATSIYGNRIQGIANQCTKYFDLSNTSNRTPNGAIEYIAELGYFAYEEIELNSYSFTINSERTHTEDAPYDIFAIPADYQTIYGAAEVIPVNKEVCWKMAQQIIVDLGEQLYDIQLLPYSPFGLINNGIDWGDKIAGKDYQKFITSDNARAGAIIWLSSGSFQRYLVSPTSIPSNPIEFKVANECDMYRIVSPTYNGEFSFSATKNGGVTGYNIFCTYKPFNPFIKIAPAFNNLYGQEFKDGRGCICQGDFSLAQISSAWVNYQTNNKNYLNAFNRQIQNMERNNAVQRELDIWNIVGGTASAIGTGAFAGASVGGGVGAAVGGLIGGGASLAAGIADIGLNERLRTEALDYTKDQFGYQLGNIAALPYTLANIGAQTIISKFFPVLEYYTATEIEKEALRNKIKYNGMTVMTVGTIAGFKQETPTYIKGKLIRLEDANEEFHFVNALANELYKGVFI